jgi:hypothetical protein
METPKNEIQDLKKFSIKEKFHSDLKEKDI